MKRESVNQKLGPAPLSYRMLGAPSALKRKEWLVRGLIGAGDLVVLFGEPGVGKSVLAVDLAFAVANGNEWFGRRTTAGAVLYIALERDAVTERRFAALQMAKPSPQPAIAISGATITLSSETAAEEIVQACTSIEQETGSPVRLIVVDTLSRAIAGQDENAASVISCVAAQLGLVTKRTGCSVLVLHHATKSTGALRGSTALLGAVDCAIRLFESKGLIAAAIEKSNDALERGALRFRIEEFTLAAKANNDEWDRAIVVVPIGGIGIERPSVDGRAEAVFQTIRRLAVDGVADRRSVLRELRAAGLVTQQSSSEQLRVSLRQLRDAGQITYDDFKVFITGRQNPKAARPP